MGNILQSVVGWAFRHFMFFIMIIVLLALSKSLIDNFDNLYKSRGLIEETPRVHIYDVSIPKLNEITEKVNKDLAFARKTTCYLPTCMLAKHYQIARLERKLTVLQAARDFNHSNRVCNQCKVQRRLTFHWESELFKNNCNTVINRYLLPCTFFSEKLNFHENQMKQQCSICNKVKQFSSIEEAVKSNWKEYNNKFCDKPNNGLLCYFINQEYSVYIADAAKILILIIFFPLALGSLTYFIVAPIATRLFSVKLLPSIGHDVTTINQSDYQHHLKIKSNEEVFVKSGLIKGVSENAELKSRWILNYKFPFTSLVSGLYGLTQAHSDQDFNVSVYGGESDDYEKSLVIHVSEGSALIIQPRSLIGVIQPKDKPLKITRHWRLGISNLLTLRFRYLAFHGPCKFIIQSNRGVAMDSVASLARINQADTIGFTANLTCKIRQSETFYAYQTGKKDIFDDCFSGENGFVLHEVKPRNNKRSIFVGRGMKGIISAALKAFGI